IYSLSYHKNNKLKLTSLSTESKIELLKKQIHHSPYISPSMQKTWDKKCHTIAQQIEMVNLLCPRWDFSMRELGHLLSGVFHTIEEDVLQRGVECATN
ncbi:MAG: hypothetical protein ACHP65_09145, partial [Legionellales bacterium]